MKPLEVLQFPIPVGVVLKEVPDFPGYFARPDGSVWGSLNSRGKIGNELRMLRGSVDKDGYRIITLRRERRPVTLRLSHVILATFVGPRPEGHEACHFPNPDPTDNRMENLMWATHAQNIQHKVLQGTVAKGMRHGMARLTDLEVAEVRRLRVEEKLSYTEIARRCSISPFYSHALCNNRYRKAA